jgi:IS5 family transposase
MEASVDPPSRGPDWMPITPKTGSLLHADSHVFGDSAYRSAEAEEKLAARGFRSRICVRGTRGRPLSKARAAANRAKSRIRARIEHVFGTQETAPGGRILRTIGIVRARLKIGLQNLVYNIRRLATLERMATA